MSDPTTFVKAAEDLPVSAVHNIYPTIDPKPFIDAQTFKNKVVLVTGASRGIGLETALHYARTGASLTLVSRKQATLDDSKNAILKEIPGAQVLTFPADVKDTAAAEAAIKVTIAKFGRLDVLVANAGYLRSWGVKFADLDPLGWWEVQEINVKGVYNYIHFAIPELLKTKGSIIVVSSMGAQLRTPSLSDYCTSKHTLGRLIEFVAIEYPEVKIFGVHPGVVATAMNENSDAPFVTVDDISLSAATHVFLSAGKADYLNGRYVSATWDLGEVQRDWKTKIVEQNGLVSKLSIPK